MTVERSYAGCAVRFTLLDGGTVRCVLAFDTGEEGSGPAVWKILLPGPTGTQDLLSVHEFLRPDAAQLTAWLTPVVGAEAATELAKAVDADPPATADWQHSPAG